MPYPKSRSPGHDPRDFLRFDVVFEKKNTASMAVLPAPTMTKLLYFLPKTGSSFIGAHLAFPSKENGGGLLEGTTTFICCVHFFLKETEYFSSDNRELNCPLPRYSQLGK